MRRYGSLININPSESVVQKSKFQMIDGDRL